MTAACPICGGVTSSPGSACARCKKRGITAASAPIDEPDELAAAGALDLDMPPPPPLVVLGADGEVAARSASRPRVDAPVGISEVAAPPPVTVVGADAVGLLAGFGPAPKGPFESLVYAVRVLRRLPELRRERDVARLRKAYEVPLYDAALKSYDEKGYTLGLMMIGVVVVVAAFAFLMPLFFRVLRNLGG